MEQLGEKLTKDPRFAQVHNLYTTDKTMLLYLFYCGHDFLSVYESMWPEGTEKQNAKDNALYLQEYMEYISRKTGRDITTTKLGEAELAYDQTRIKNFLTTLNWEDASPAVIDTSSREYVQAQTDQMIIERFGHSSDVIQNVLYDIATQVYGMHIENDIDVLR